MKSMQPGKRFVALSAAVAIGLGGVALTVPALATNDSPDEQFRVAAAAAFTASDSIAAIGHGENGEIVAQVVADAPKVEVDEALAEANAYANEQTGGDIVVQEVASRYSNAPVASGLDQAAEALAFDASDDIVAGAGYVAFKDGAGGHCSVGFPAVGPNGEDALITAGHCSDVGGEVFMERPSTSNVYTGTYETAEWDESRKVGEFTHSQYGPALYEDVLTEGDLDPAQMQDFAVITVDEAAGFNLIGEVATWSDDSGKQDDLAADTTPIKGVHDVTTADIGSEVFHSGRTTGKTSGDIGWDGEEHGNVSVGGIVDGYAPVGDGQGNNYMVYGFASETTVAGGDSGGTVMMGDQAVGVVSGGIDASDDMPAMLWTAELAMGLEHLPTGYEILTTEEGSSPTPTDTATPTATPTETSSPTPTETDDAVDAELVVDPQEIAAERFLADDEEQAIAEDRGVTYAVSGVEPGAEVTFDTYASADSDSANAGAEAAASTDAADAPAKSVTVTADDNGNAGSRVWGLTTAPAEAYIGEYQVVVSIEGGETLNSGFSVVGEGGGEGGQDDGGDLPRTGSTVAPLAAGAAGLLALGGALTYIARRRNA